MALTRFAINRPVAIAMLIMALVLMGVVAYGKLNVQLLPKIDSAAVTVITTYNGATAEDMEQLVTKQVEDAVATLGNLDYISSSSKEGVSQVLVVFLDNVSADLAPSDVNSKVNSVRDKLPSGINEPSILKYDPNQAPMLNLGLAGAFSLRATYDLARDTVQQQLQVLPGVGAINLTGGLDRQIDVVFDPYRLRAFGISVPQLVNAINNQNDGTPGGAVAFGRQQVATRLYGRYFSAEQMRDLPITGGSTGTVLLRNVASVRESHKPVYTRTFVDGKEGVGLSVSRQSGANEVATDDGLLAGLKDVSKVLPQDTTLTPISDMTATTRSSIDGVQRSLIEAVLLTAAVILIFLHSFRGTIIVLCAIPTSLITTYAGMLMFGFTLNVITCMALVLVIGVLVDDSIVVIENIIRHLELGESPMDAAINGRTEIGMAAMAITFVDVVVYAPIAFMTGTTGQVFKEFGLTVVVSVLLSLFVSFTLTPMLSSRFMKSAVPGEQPGGGGPWGVFSRAFDRGFGWLEQRYESALRWSLAHRWLPPLAAMVLLAGAIALVPLGFVRNEYLPQVDGGVMTVMVELPPGSSLLATDQTLRLVEAQLDQIPEVDHYMSTSGIQQPGQSADWSTDATARFGNVNVGLVDQHHRHRRINPIMEDLRQRVQEVPDAKITVQIASTTGSSASPVQVRVRGQDDATVVSLADKVAAIVRQTPGAVDVDTDWKPGNPEARLVPARLFSPQVGVTAQDAGQVLQAMTQGIVASKLRQPGQREADIRVLSEAPYDAELSALKAVPLMGSQDGQPVTVSLNQVAQIDVGAGPTELKRYNRARTVTITANVGRGFVLNQVTDPIQKAIDDQIRGAGQFPPGYFIEFGGDAQEQGKSFGQILFALGLSIGLVYMLLAALYESLILPFAVLFALPVALVGALGGLAITQQTLNLISMIGLIVLMALVAKNGILLVDFTNHLREQGLSRYDALLRAGPTRMRPIFMTSSAMILGMMPLAIGLEPGSELYTAMATEIIGGMATSTLLSLLVVPCMYTYFDDLQILLGRLVAWRPGRRPPADTPTPTPTPEPSAVAG
jgi:hydrophobic/amphiphilic exporter-1 (mainly G- bacteria), HAE1 family